MENNSWDFDLEEIKPQELTEKELDLAKTCAEIEIEFEEAISLIENNEEKEL